MVFIKPTSNLRSKYNCIFGLYFSFALKFFSQNLKSILQLFTLEFIYIIPKYKVADWQISLNLSAILRETLTDDRSAQRINCISSKATHNYNIRRRHHQLPSNAALQRRRRRHRRLQSILRTAAAAAAMANAYIN